MTRALRPLLAAALLGAAASAPAIAEAADVTLWACHGPGGQALGVPPLVAETGGDGLVTTFGGGCTAPATGLGDGGLRAAFTRPDPTGASMAAWRLDVPDMLTLTGVRVTRRTLGLGGTPVPGGGQRYVADSSGAVLESASVQDGSNVALDGTLTATASGTSVRLGVRCERLAYERCAAPSTTPLGVELGAIALTVADADAPRGAVGGVVSPAIGALDLRVRATDAGVGLASARATLDGTLVASADLGGATCADLSPQDPALDLPVDGSCPATVTDAPLRVDTTTVADGVHRLVVSVRDAAGNVTTIHDDDLRVANTPRVTKSSAPLTVGSGNVDVPSGGGDGGVTGSGSGGSGSGSGGGTGLGTGTTGVACLDPNLTMVLRSRPLRLSKGRPVLRRNARALFTGRLACLVKGRRAAAPAGVVVTVTQLVGKRLTIKNGVTTRPGGRITVILPLASSRLVRFEHVDATGRRARSSIRVVISKRRSGR